MTRSQSSNSIEQFRKRTIDVANEKLHFHCFVLYFLAFCRLLPAIHVCFVFFVCFNAKWHVSLNPGINRKSPFYVKFAFICMDWVKAPREFDWTIALLMIGENANDPTETKLFAIKLDALVQKKPTPIIQKATLIARLWKKKISVRQPQNVWAVKSLTHNNILAFIFRIKKKEKYKEKNSNNKSSVFNQSRIICSMDVFGCACMNHVCTHQFFNL